MKTAVKLLLLGGFPIFFLSGFCDRVACVNGCNNDRVVVQSVVQPVVQPVIQRVRTVQRVYYIKDYQPCRFENCYSGYRYEYVPCRGYSTNGECVVW